MLQEKQERGMENFEENLSFNELELLTENKEFITKETNIKNISVTFL